ncbi:MAG: Vgb family protein [Solirubrobacterales bacterium]
MALPLPSRALARELTPGFKLGESVTASALVQGPDGNLWFAGQHYLGYTGAGYAAMVGRATPSGEVAAFTIPNLAEPSGQSISYSTASAIASGPDGALWFTAQTPGPVVGRITLAGEISQYPLPPGASTATSITLGSDGNLWFTEREASRIGRITPTGEIAEFGLPGSAHPVDITAGPDGALWFTEQGSNRIGRITPAGAVSEYPLPSRTSRPNRLTLGPDGNLWFTEVKAPEISSYESKYANHVGRISTTGAVSQFRVADRESESGDIVSGPGGKLWFTTGGYGPNREILWIAPDGRTAPGACVVVCGYQAEGLASGPDGRLWFATGIPYNDGGGGSGLLMLGDPGYLGTYAPPARTLGISVPPLRHGISRIRVSCENDAPCSGVLRIRKKLGLNPPWIGGGHYSLGPEQSSTFTLHLNVTGRRLLRKEHGRLPAYVVDGAKPPFGQVRAVVLRSGHSTS